MVHLLIFIWLLIAFNFDRTLELHEIGLISLWGKQFGPNTYMVCRCRIILWRRLQSNQLLDQLVISPFTYRRITASDLINTIVYVTFDEFMLADVSAILQQLQWNILSCPATLQRQIRKWLYAATHINHVHQSFLFFTYGLLFTRKIQLLFIPFYLCPISVFLATPTSAYTLRTSGRGEWELRRAYCLIQQRSSITAACIV
jgi:hypothetical protein